MKKIKFIAEVLITLACLHMVHSLAQKHGSVSYDINLIPSQHINANGLNIADIDNNDANKYLAEAENVDDLNARAKAEANRMLETGDISAFEEELGKTTFDEYIR